MVNRVLVFLLLSFVITIISFAGTTGKLTGYVKDGETGDPIPGVNVVIAGTGFGAATD